MITRPIIQPFLEVEPDKSHLAWDSNIEEWTGHIDYMSQIPTYYYVNHASFLSRSMPVHAYYRFSDDLSSLLFFWDKSPTPFLSSLFSLILQLKLPR